MAVDSQADITSLPQEITDSIIDHLHDDKSALKSCALVQRSWLHRSRHHLHRSVSLDSNLGDDKLSGYYNTGAAKYIQNLTLVAPPQPHATHRRGSVSLNTQPVWRVIPQFTGIKNLTIVFFNWRGAHKSESYDRLSAVTRNVSHLTLVIADFNDVSDFLSFLTLFPELRSLSVSSLTFGNRSWGATPSKIAYADVAPKLSAIRFSNTHPSSIACQALGDWFSSMPRQFEPKYSLTWTGAGSTDGLTKVLHGLGSNLAHLELDVFSASKLAFSQDDSLRFSTSLESIKFVELLYFSREEVQWVLFLLSRIQSLALRKLEFICTSSCFGGVDEHSLQTLDDVLSTPAYADLALDEVVFKFSGINLKQHDIENVMKKGLKRIEARGALRCVFPASNIEV